MNVKCTSILIAFCLISVLTTFAQKKINGVFLSVEKTPVHQSDFGELDTTNAQWLAVSANAFGSSFSPLLEFDAEWQDPISQRSAIAQVLKIAHSQGYKTFVRFELNIEGDDETPSFVSRSSELKLWQDYYRSFVMSYAVFCDSMDVELIGIGNNLPVELLIDTIYWNGLIDTLRSVYKGKLTYGADWPDFEAIPFWHALDYIGVNAFFSCDSGDAYDVGAIKVCLHDYSSVLKSLAENHEKTVLFTSYGYRSITETTNYAFKESHETPYTSPQNYDQLSQIYALNAFYKIFWTQSYIAGGFVWKWHLGLDAKDFSKTNGYTPQDKPVLQIIKEWYRLF